MQDSGFGVKAAVMVGTLSAWSAGCQTRKSAKAAVRHRAASMTAHPGREDKTRTACEKKEKDRRIGEEQNVTAGLSLRVRR